MAEQQFHPAHTRQSQKQVTADDIKHRPQPHLMNEVEKHERVNFQFFSFSFSFLSFIVIRGILPLSV